MPFKNRYFLCRHGQSEANVEGVISSDPDYAVWHHGLSPVGVEQAEAAAKSFFDIVYSPERKTPVEIYTSDFKRAQVTAGIIGGRLKVALTVKDYLHPYVADGNARVFKVEKRLRERNFGDLEGASNENYQKVLFISIYTLFPNHKLREKKVFSQKKPITVQNIRIRR